MSDRSQTGVFFRFLRRYLNDYGGASAIFLSPFFLGALLMTFASIENWDGKEWKEVALSTIPNLLGFSLGTYALLFSLISKRLKGALRAVKNQRQVSYLDEINATFFHFIFIQVITVAWIFLSYSRLITDVHNFLMVRSLCPINFMPFLRELGNFIGMLLFTYSLLLVIAASLAVYRISRLVEPDD